MEEKKLQELFPEVLNGLSGELKEKAKACSTPEELAALLGEAGVELPDELLDGVAGGYETRNWSYKNLI